MVHNGPMKKLLLLIEDNPLLTGLYQTAFEKAGFEVLLAHDGETGLHLAQEKNPEGIVLDLLMPGIDGFEVLKQLKDHESTKHMKTVVLTSLIEGKDLERAKKLGALDCIVKSESTLAEIVERAGTYFK